MLFILKINFHNLKKLLKDKLFILTFKGSWIVINDFFLKSHFTSNFLILIPIEFN